MSNVRLSKQRKVLERLDLFVTTVHDVTFIQVDEDNGGVEFELSVKLRDWEDMGRPDRITVTIEPGDLLNTGG